MSELEWIERTLLASGLVSPGRLAAWLQGWQRESSLLRHLVARGVLDSAAARTVGAVIQGYVQMAPETVLRLFRGGEADTPVDVDPQPAARAAIREPAPRSTPARVVTRLSEDPEDMSQETAASASAPTLRETSPARAAADTLRESPPRRHVDITADRPAPASSRRTAEVPSNRIGSRHADAPGKPAPSPRHADAPASKPAPRPAARPAEVAEAPASEPRPAEAAASEPPRRAQHVPSDRHPPSASSPELRAAVDLALSSSGGARPLWPAAGERFAGYDLQRLLRSGPGYAMYRGRIDERRVIVKLQRAGEAAVQRAAYARLGHPAIVPLLAAGTAEGLGFLAFDDHAGLGLDEYVRITGPLETARVVRIGVAAAEALGSASRVGVVHGDLGPERLLVCSSDARVELIDFMAPIADDPGAHAVHRAPEQRAGGPASPRADMYSLGVALHLAATGRPPITLGLRAPLPGLPHALSAVIGLLLHPQPERRPASWSHVAAALQANRPRAHDMSFGTGEENTP